MQIKVPHAHLRRLMARVAAEIFARGTSLASKVSDPWQFRAELGKICCFEFMAKSPPKVFLGVGFQLIFLTGSTLIS